MIFYSDFRDSDNDCKSNLFFFFSNSVSTLWDLRSKNEIKDSCAIFI
jgi:hypothetical protein